jgi:arsenate reductase
MHTPIRVLFLSDSNSVRSQMAEGLLRSLGGDRYDVHSAGLDEPRPLHPLTLQVMAEANLDISGQRSKHLNDYLDTQFDYVITLCDRARVACPDFARDNETLHWHLDDPTDALGSDADKLAAFRHARDELRSRLESWIAATSASQTR